MPGETLSPLERVILRLKESGADMADIAAKVGKKPGTVERIIAMAGFKEGIAAGEPKRGEGLRPVERVVARLRAQGESYGEIGNRIGKSGHQVRKIEEYAGYKLGG